MAMLTVFNQANLAADRHNPGALRAATSYVVPQARVVNVDTSETRMITDT